MFIKKSLLAVCLTAAFAFATSLNWSVSVVAQEEKPQPQILFTNVNVFDGKSDKLATGMSVLVEGNLIKKVAKGKIDAGSNAKVIDGGGRTLMPGLHDQHVHFSVFNPVNDERQSMTPFHVGGEAMAHVQGQPFGEPPKGYCGRLLAAC